MTRQPLVSVLMNCFNGAKYLREAIESVLVQTYPNWELIFWDNRSADASAEICRSFGDPRIKYFLAPQHTNLGEARALAYAQISGELVAVLDTDDLWEPEKLARQTPLFDDSSIGIAISDVRFFTDDGKSLRRFAGGAPPQGMVFDQLLDSYFVPVETVLLRRSAIDALAQAFDPELSHISDFDLVVRLARDWKLAYTDEVLAHWRVHASSGSWAEPDRFFREKLLFVEKMDALPEFAASWDRCRKRFMERTMTSEAMTRLGGGDVDACREILRHCRWTHWRAFVVFALSFLPFGGEVIRRYRGRKAELC
jgi:glycosyltransferase involved in cell wall biosynthesis